MNTGNEKMEKPQMEKPQTDVDRISKLLEGVRSLSCDVRDRAFELHSPILEDKKTQDTAELPKLVGGRIIDSLQMTRDVLQEALEALKGFN